MWVLTALLNAIASGTVLSCFSSEFARWPEAFFLVLIFTLIFSIPGIFIFWIVLLANWHAALLFRFLLRTGLIISALSSLLLYLLPIEMLNGHRLFLSICLVTSTITSIMIHHTHLRYFIEHKTQNHV